jgi:hypothetical protein
MVPSGIVECRENAISLNSLTLLYFPWMKLSFSSIDPSTNQSVYNKQLNRNKVKIFEIRKSVNLLMSMESQT